MLGTWTCDGYFVGDAGNATSGVWVISRQVFAFEDGDTIITQGTEIADIGKENLRPVTGATGHYADVQGDLIQTTLGFNDFMAISATYEFETQMRDDAARDMIDYDNSKVAEDEAPEWDSGAPVGSARPHISPSS